MKANNKIIAEFMGDKPKELLYRNVYKDYSSSWDLLMPVVEKIESLSDTKGDSYRFTITMYDASIKGTDIEILGDAYYEGSEQKIMSTYQAVVEFIKQYNDGKDK